MAQKRISGIVSGRVQGVGFRYFTREIALRCHLTGWVRNLHNGDVAFEAQGDEEGIAKFYERLIEGPSFGQVADCNVNEAEVVPEENSFKIRY
ncbi:MAG: acylphosphatase [Chitinivibrionales bacterium]|nr:acylphosphatase [Chitinivibrionales bacterium]